MHVKQLQRSKLQLQTAAEAKSNNCRTLTTDAFGSSGMGGNYKWVVWVVYGGVD